MSVLPSSGAQARQSDIVDELIDRVDTTTDRLRGRIHDISSFLDRIMGPTPEKPPSPLSGTPTTIIRSLDSALDRLNIAVNDLEMVIARARR